MSEVKWKDYQGYKVSNTGKVIGKYKKELKPADNGNGYLHIVLMINGFKKHKYIHRLVAELFIPNPKKLPQINHIDGNKNNNDISNLEWCTSSHNLFHASKIGLTNRKGENNGFSKLNWKIVDDIRHNMSTPNPVLAKKYNIDVSNISRIKNNKIWVI